MPEEDPTPIESLHSEIGGMTLGLDAARTRKQVLEESIRDTRERLLQLEASLMKEQKSIGQLEATLSQLQFALNNLTVAQPLIDLFKNAPGIATVALSSQAEFYFRDGKRTLLDFSLLGERSTDDLSAFGNIVLFPEGTLRMYIHGKDENSVRVLSDIVEYANKILGKQAQKSDSSGATVYNWTDIDVSHLGVPA